MAYTERAQRDLTDTDTRQARVLFLNTRDTLGADVAVHLMLMRSLDRAAVRLWVGSGTYEAPDGPLVGAELRRIPDLTVWSLNLGKPVTGARGLARLGALARNLTAVSSLARLAWRCRRERVDIIHATERPRDALFAVLLARAAGSMCLIQAHTNYYPHDARGPYDWTLRHTTAIVGVSRFTADAFARGLALPEGTVFAVHNAVDTEQFQPLPPQAALRERAEFRARFGIPPDVPLIGCVARLMRWKGQDELIGAFAQARRAHPTARLLLAGSDCDVAPDGPGGYRDYLERRVAAAGLTDAVAFAGFLPGARMPALYRSLDALAHPSFEEPFGLAVIEAMACGCPLVAVNAGGIPEIVRDGTDGLLVTREAPDELACALIRLLADARLRQCLGRAGRARVLDQFTLERQARAMTEVYRQLLAHRGHVGIQHEEEEEGDQRGGEIRDLVPIHAIRQIRRRGTSECLV